MPACFRGWPSSDRSAVHLLGAVQFAMHFTVCSSISAFLCLGALDSGRTTIDCGPSAILNLQSKLKLCTPRCLHDVSSRAERRVSGLSYTWSANFEAITATVMGTGAL